jgi:hypothetical protein
MGVLNSPAAASISRSAGWNPGDGSMVSFLVQRGREFMLAQPSMVEDFGCSVGKMYSVGKRHYGAGERIIGIVPNRYNPGQISGSPRPGYHRVLIWVHAVGRGNCANGFRNLVLVIAYVHVTPKHVAPKPKPRPAPRPAPKPAPPQGNCNIVNSPNSNACNQTVIYVICSNGVTIQVNTQGKTVQEIKDTVQQACNTTTTTETTTTETTTQTTTVVTTTTPKKPPKNKPKDCATQCPGLP